MIVEHARLCVRPGSEADFEAAMLKARPLISAQPGFLGFGLARGIEAPNVYLLRVEWESVEAHTEGFRQSPEYEQWRDLLHHFYEPFPVVEHFRPVA